MLHSSVPPSLARASEVLDVAVMQRIERAVHHSLSSGHRRRSLYPTIIDD